MAKSTIFAAVGLVFAMFFMVAQASQLFMNNQCPLFQPQGVFEPVLCLHNKQTVIDVNLNGVDILSATLSLNDNSGNTVQAELNLGELLGGLLGGVLAGVLQLVVDLVYVLVNGVPYVQCLLNGQQVAPLLAI